MQPLDYRTGSPKLRRQHADVTVERFKKPIDMESPLFKEKINKDNCEKIVEKTFSYHPIPTYAASTIVQFIETTDKTHFDLLIPGLINYADSITDESKKVQFYQEMAELTRIAYSQFHKDDTIDNKPLVELICIVGARINFSNTLYQATHDYQATGPNLEKLKGMVKMITLYDIQRQTENSFFREDNFASRLSVCIIKNHTGMQEFFGRLNGEIKELLSGRITNHGSQIAVHKNSLLEKFGKNEKEKVEKKIIENQTNFAAFCKQFLDFLVSQTLPQEVKEVINIRSQIIKSEMKAKNIDELVTLGGVDILLLKIIGPYLSQTLHGDKSFLTPLKRSVPLSFTTELLRISGNLSDDSESAMKIKAFIIKNS